MSLKLMFVAVSWIAVTVALIGVTYRWPDVKPKEARQFWFMLFVFSYLGVVLWNARSSSVERRQRAMPVTRVLSQSTTQYQNRIFDGEIVYREKSPGVLYDSVLIRASELDWLLKRSVPSEYAGKEVVISNGRYADEKRAEEVEK